MKKLLLQIEQHQEKIDELTQKLELEYFKVFDDSGKIQDLIKKAKDHNFDYYQQDFDGVSGYICTPELKEYSQLELQFLSNYLDRDYCIYLDKKNETVSIFLGDAIFINRSDNSIYDTGSRKSIADFNSDITDQKLKQLIEDYQEEKGEYSYIFEQDYYGGLELFKPGEGNEKN